MKYLTAIEIEQLNKIKDAIFANSLIGQVLGWCEKVKQNLNEPPFAYTYAAILLATKNRIEEAIQLFEMNTSDIFSSIMIEYLRDVGAFVMVSKVFKSARPYHIYTQTPLYQTHEQGVVTGIMNFAMKNPPPGAGATVTIMDIGPGDGELTARYVNAIAPLYKLKSIHLIFVDPFEEEIKTAIESCKAKITIPCEFTGIHCKIQEISKGQIEEIVQAKPVWFINAALSVHHMTWEQKIPMLKQMKTLSPNFILSEVNWNHDLPEKDSPELLYSVAKNYGVFCKDILSLPLPEEDRKLCLYHFPIDEAINIIKQERPKRIDYHTPIEEWKKIARDAGFTPGEAMATYLSNGEPFLFTMEFSGV